MRPHGLGGRGPTKCKHDDQDLDAFLSTIDKVAIEDISEIGSARMGVGRMMGPEHDDEHPPPGKDGGRKDDGARTC